MEFSGKRAVVTGAASGIGRALAAELVARGATVMITDIAGVTLREVAEELGDAASPMVCDVSHHAQVEALGVEAQARMGGCDLVFANAGVIASGRLTRMSPAEVDWLLGVNLRGAWSTAAVFGAMLAEQAEGGHIVFTGSEHSLGLQHAGAGIYTASKHAVLGLAEVLRAEAPANVKVSVLCPGLVSTGLGTARRPEGVPQQRQDPMSRMVLEAGMPADEVARRTLDGVARGDFYIVTHPHSFRAAERRFAELQQAYAEQAPWFDGADKWDINVLVPRIAAEMKAKGD